MRTPLRGVCDFCMPAQPARWSYPAKSFRMAPFPGQPIQMSENAWAACDGCSEMIEADNRVALVVQLGLPLRELRRVQRSNIDKFMANRTGDRQGFG